MEKFKLWFKNFDFKLKLLNFIKWKIIDFYRDIRYGRKFDEYGCTFYVGRQGSGKTTAMVEYLEFYIRKKYPKCLILTNFNYVNQTKPFTGWRDFFEVRNGDDGVVFAIDEIQNEFNSNDWRNFPESLLSELTQQRKQRIKIICTSQVFTRVAKPIREQAFEVVECRTIAKRWTFLRCFDGDEYNRFIETNNLEVKFKVPRLWRRSFIITDYIRSLFDTDKKIERLADREYLSRSERVY